MPTLAPHILAPQTFRPDVFFEGVWQAWGLVKDLSGRVVERFEVRGEGRTKPLARVFEVEEQYAFSSGREDRLTWRLSTDDLGAFSGVEVATGARGQGRQHAQGYEWRFARRTQTALGPRRVRLCAQYHQLTDDEALCVTTLRWAGLRIATLSSIYRRG